MEIVLSVNCNQNPLIVLIWTGKKLEKKSGFTP